MTPIVVGDNPPPNTDRELSYPPGVVAGIPSWAFTIIMYTFLATFVLIWAVNLLPNSFPQPSMEAEGINPNAISATSAELGRQVSDDAPNASARVRRSSLSKDDSQAEDTEK